RLVPEAGMGEASGGKYVEKTVHGRTRRVRFVGESMRTSQGVMEPSRQLEGDAAGCAAGNESGDILRGGDRARRDAAGARFGAPAARRDGLDQWLWIGCDRDFEKREHARRHPAHEFAGAVR